MPLNQTLNFKLQFTIVKSKMPIWQLFILFMLPITTMGQTLLDKNQVIKGSGWKEENEKYFMPLEKINYKFTPDSFSIFISEDPSIKVSSAYLLFRPNLIEPIKTNRDNLIQELQSDTASLILKSLEIEQKINAIEEAILFIVNNTDSSNKKDKLLSENFITNLKDKKSLIEIRLKLLRFGLRDKLVINLNSLSNITINNSLTYSEYLKARKDVHEKDSLSNIARFNIKSAFSDINDALTDINKKFVAYKETVTPEKKESNSNVSVLPALNAKLGKRELLPNITILGNSLLGNTDDWFGTISLFTGAGGNPKNLVTLDNLIFQEFSSFGFTSNFNFSFLPANNRKSKNKVALNFGINYLGKNLQKSDTSDFNTSVFQFKAGCEYAIDPDKLSLYLNFNRLTVADNVKSFEKEFGLSNKLFGFTEFGARFQLGVAQNNNTFLDIDLGFIANTNDVKLITQTSDLVIPRIKIGIKQKILK